MFLRKRGWQEIEKQLADAVDELADALQRLLEGKRSAARTIASNLRLMLGPGWGDRLFWRVAEAKGVEVASVWQSQGLKFGENENQLGVLVVVFGPSFYNSPEDAPPGSIEVPLTEALDSRCFTVVSEAGGTKDLTWLEVIVTVANKVAVHADDEIPAVLDQLDGLIVHNGENAGFEHVLRKVAEVVVPRGQAVVGAGG